MTGVERRRCAALIHGIAVDETRDTEQNASRTSKQRWRQLGELAEIWFPTQRCATARPLTHNSAQTL